MTMIEDLYGHMAWADATVWRVVLASETAAADVKIREVLGHLHSVQRGFLAIWRDETPAFPELSAFPTARSIMQWGRDYHSQVDLGAYGERDRIVHLPWSEYLTRRFGRKPEETTLAQTMMQVAMHSNYHRGQANMRLRELGIEPPLVDFITWLWIGRPAPEWADEQ